MKRIINFLMLAFSFSLGIFCIDFFGRYFAGLGSPILYDEDPLVGYRLKPNQNKRRLKGAQVTTDDDGFRVDKSLKLKNNNSILFVGDSVTYGGSYIDNKELFTSIFCRINNYSTCLNSGLNAWGIGNMGRFISNLDLYTTKKIDNVVIVVLPHDDTRNIQNIRGLPYWTSDPKFPKAFNEVIRFSVFKYLKIIVQKKVENNQDNIILKNKIIEKARDANWEEFNSMLSKNKFNSLNIVITPPKDWLNSPKKNKSQITFYKKKLDEIAKINNVIKTCNLIEYLPVQNNYEFWYVDDMHLSKEGHEQWAKSIGQCILN